MKLRKFIFTYKRFFKIRTFEIEAFSRCDAIEKFYANFPRAKILYGEEVTDEPQ